MKLKTAIDGQENVKLTLRDCEQRSVLQRVPPLLVNGSDFMIGKEQRNARIYAFVIEEAHSRSWLLATSSTATTCSCEMGG